VTAARVLYVVVCGAGPASRVAELVTAAQAEGWDVHVVATPPGRGFVDPAALEALTGNPVRSAYRSAGQPRGATPQADAVIVAPATYNMINKLAAGIADNYALGVLAECVGAGVPLVILPFINAALASRAPLRVAVERLRAEGVRVLLGSGEFEPHAPGEGEARVAAFPWTLALRQATTMAAGRASESEGSR
jgi:phosphopantothenoylcysteine synthetase/decarboxylase